MGSGVHSGRSTTDLTKSSPSNIQSRLTTDSSSTYFLQGRRFTFSPMIGGPNQFGNNHVIQES